MGIAVSTKGNIYCICKSQRTGNLNQTWDIYIAFQQSHNTRDSYFDYKQKGI